MTSEADAAVRAHMSVEAKKDRLAQHQDGTWKLTLTVAPQDMPDPLLTAMPGTRYIVVFVEIDDVEQPVLHATSSSQEVERKHFGDLQRSTQAALICKEWKFWEWLQVENEEQAAQKVRDECGVKSRSELNESEASGEVWDDLFRRYEEHIGRQLKKMG